MTSTAGASTSGTSGEPGGHDLTVSSDADTLTRGERRTRNVLLAVYALVPISVLGVVVWSLFHWPHGH